MLTLPRELSLKDGQLIQQPVRELLGYRGDPVMHKDVPLAPYTRLPGVSGRVLDLTVDVRPESEGSLERFTICLAENETYNTSICYNVRKGTLCLDRTDSGFHYNIVHKRRAPVRDQGGKIRFRIILDRFSVELFVNGGEQVMSACLYTPQEADGISFRAEGTGWFDVEKYELIL